MKVLLVTMVLLSLQPSAHASYSIFEDYIDPALTSRHKMRVSEVVRKGEPDVNVGNYTYNEHGKVTERAYLDGTFNYKYNKDGTLKKASSLIDHRADMIIQHTKENAISQYTYENGRVVSETKKVFSFTASNLEGVPEVIYTISYLYNKKNKLVQRHQFSTESPNSIVFDYTYNGDDRIVKIDEIKKTGNIITDRDLLLLTYNRDAEISKAVHKKQTTGANGIIETVVKTVDINYYADKVVYPFYYVDPVKEWKVDRDFFALSYYPIREITTTEGTSVINITYEYVDDNRDSFPESFISTMTVSNGDPTNSTTKQYTYSLKSSSPSYGKYTTRISAFNNDIESDDSYRIGFKLPVASHKFMTISDPLAFRESINDKVMDYSHHGYSTLAPETAVQYAVKSERTGAETTCGDLVPVKGQYYIIIKNSGCDLIVYGP